MNSPAAKNETEKRARYLGVKGKISRLSIVLMYALSLILTKRIPSRSMTSLRKVRKIVRLIIMK